MALKLEHSTIANCDVAFVWKAFSETDRWSEWSKLFSRATWIEGDPWVKGSALLLEVAQPNAKVRATVAESSAPHQAKWKGNVMGVNIEHHFVFASQADGTTVMKSEINLSGAATFFINDDMKKKGLQAFVQWFDAMKAHAESIAANPAS